VIRKPARQPLRKAYPQRARGKAAEWNDPDPKTVDVLAKISACMYICESERRAEAQKYCTLVTTGVTILGTLGGGPGVGLTSGLICAFGCPYLLEREHVQNNQTCERQCYR
jgi:hypothetical protein